MRVWIGLALVAASCAPSVGDARFEVLGTNPALGDPVYPQSLIELEFSEAIDPDSCAAAVVLGGLADNDELAWVEDAVLRASDNGANRWQVDHPELREDQDYALAVQSGPDGCRSFLGKDLEPFTWRFRVTSRVP